MFISLSDTINTVSIGTPGVTNLLRLQVYLDLGLASLESGYTGLVVEAVTI